MDKKNKRECFKKTPFYKMKMTSFKIKIKKIDQVNKSERNHVV